jgi:hypothetical protein
MTMKIMAQRWVLAVCVLASPCVLRAETPGEFRPPPTLQPAENASAKGTNVQPLNEYPVSHAPLVNTAKRKPKLKHPGAPTLQGDQLVFNSGWEMIEAPKLHAGGAALSRENCHQQQEF